VSPLSILALGLVELGGLWVLWVFVVNL